MPAAGVSAPVSDGADIGPVGSPDGRPGDIGDWDSVDISAIRAVQPDFDDAEIVRLLDHYRQRGKRQPVTYAMNGMQNGRLQKDLERIRGGGIADSADLDTRPDAGRQAETDSPSRRLVLTRASEITPLPVRWGWYARMPAGHVSLIPGREGIGKSLLLIDHAARLTRGTLPGCYFGEPRSVFYCATEDSWQHTIVPRLIAAGADLDYVYRIEVEAVEVSTGSSITLELTMPRDCALVAAEVKRLDVAMIALDPLMSVIDRGVDTHNDRELRTVLEPLGRLADETGCMIVGLAHFNKGNSGDPLNLVTGSRAFTAFVRSVVAIARDPDTGQCVISQEKNNLGRLDLPNLTYVIEPSKVETKDGQHCDTARIKYTGESGKSVRDILADAAATPADRSERADCAEWLRGKLRDGAQPTKEIEKEVVAVGYSVRTLDRVRKQLRIKAYQKIDGDKRVWYLELPNTAANSPAPLAP
jgi:hypothetical protein